ncbi:unnamed protein product [Phytophthora fragariaefolia]|uniref:Unnamed protein product n=1 Tax=Phytophthora fragariaefolia TaxID=1490495 RepID=A0A9W6U538_9STRA|nr:unnamed protein product [Phytophthora fragariaefolia]
MRTEFEMLTLALPPKTDIYKERFCQPLVGRISILIHASRNKPVAVEKKTSGFEIAYPPTEPCLKRPRRKQNLNVRLSDYVVGHVQATTDVQIPTTYKQARACKFWPQWRTTTLAELESLKDHKTWKLVPRTDPRRTRSSLADGYSQSRKMNADGSKDSKRDL